MIKNRRVFNNNKIVMLIEGIVLVMVLFLTIGYSTFSTNLFAGDFIVNVRPDKNVRITSFSIDHTNNNGSSSEIDYNISRVYGNLSLPNATSSVTYTVEVKNYGNIEMGISSIELPSELDDILDVIVDGYTLGTKIRDNSDSCENSVNGCTLSINRTFNITVKYKENKYNSEKTSFNNFKLDFLFIECHEVIFTGFTVLKPSMDAKSVLDGSTYSYNIGPYETLLLRMDGITLTNYTIDNNNLLTVPNVTGDLEIIISEIMLPVQISITQDDALIKYSVNGTDYKTVTGMLDIEAPIGSTLDIEVSKYGYRKLIKNYIIGLETFDEITMDRVYYLNINSIPADANISCIADGMSEVSSAGSFSAEYDPGTIVTVTITRPGYRTEKREYILNNHINESFDLVKQYIYTVNAIKPTNANLYLTINNGERQKVSSGYSIALDVNSIIKLEASASNHISKVYNHTLTDDITDNVSLVRLYTYTVNPSKSDSIVTLTYDGNNYTGKGSQSITIEENKSVSWTITRDYYQSQSGSDSNINSDITKNINMQFNTIKTATASRSSDIGLGNNNKDTTFSASIPSDARIISANLTGGFTVSVTGQDLKIVSNSNNNVQLWSQTYDGKTFSSTSINASYSCANYVADIDSCNAMGTVNTTLSKGSSIILGIQQDIVINVQYIEK